MEVVFCDLCNESVPLTDLRQGRAVRRAGRVICAACEVAMSAQAPANSPHSAVLSAPHPAEAPDSHLAPARGAAPVVLSRGSGVGVVMGLFVLVVGALALHRVDLRLESFEEAQVAQAKALQTAREQSARALEAAASVRAGSGVLEQRLANSEANTASLREELERRAQHSAAQAEEQLAREAARADDLRRSFEAQLLERERRIEELGLRLAKSEDGVRVLRQQLDQALAEALAAREREPAASQPAPPAPAWQAFLPRLFDENPSVRWQAVDELSRAGDPAVLEPVCRALADKDLFVRMRAAGALGELKLEAGIPALLDALADPEPMVREAACQSLKLVSGRDPRFDPLASESEREKRLRALREAYAGPKQP
jgi:hypothetical protein